MPKGLKEKAKAAAKKAKEKVLVAAKKAKEGMKKVAAALKEFAKKAKERIQAMRFEDRDIDLTITVDAMGE